MTLWTAIVLIVLIVAIAGVMKSRNNARLGYGTDEDGKPVGDPGREAEMRREIEELRERVKVLERIATEDREAKRLSADIERLRDQR